MIQYIRTKLTNHDEINLILLSDIHFGATGIKEETFKPYINMVKNNENTYMILNGDLIEAAQRNSPGSSIFQQEISPQGQIEWMNDTFEPIKDKILATVEGNHEKRFTKNCGISVMKNFARELKIPFVPAQAFVRIALKNNAYTLFITHGSSGAKLPHTRMANVLNLTRFIGGADILAMGHVHDLAHSTIVMKSPDHREKRIIDKTIHLVLTGHFLPYDNYAAESLMMPSNMGAPIIHLGDDIVIDVLGLNSVEYKNNI
jgi:predicted phosphodiesterase